MAELIEALSKAEREGRLVEKIRFYARASLLIVDEIGYLPITSSGANGPGLTRPHWGHSPLQSSSWSTRDTKRAR
ncbi:ATP-binding protein [Pseudoruegeria sp. SK021]|uniref:ATP-binding protein n=1 Tax=Pseudoruegeria sp. SK021 TaxID=1933035 RepID=UPI000A235505|nr:ATP-binding protein [Pseudoruegeria sp. SK021]OSP56832.1 hypothetical protein BV911_02530 [Pseudoruegeria sp. SK021]